MITLQQFMECIQYRVSNSDEYCWDCYGPDARSMDSEVMDQYTITCVFDTKENFVYEMQVWDYVNDLQYRWIFHDYYDDVVAESKKRNIIFEESADSKKFIELDLEQDILEKAAAIVRGEDYDKRVLVNITWEEDLLFLAMKQAHEQDITFNEYISNILRAEIDKAKA